MAKNRFSGMSDQMKKAVGKSDLQVSKKPKNTVIELNVAEIINPPFHDRYSVNHTSIKDLAEDISVHGLINPITVRQLEDGTYQRISGFRRVEAFKLLGKQTIPAIVFDVVNDIEILEIMFAENQHREAPSEYDIVVFHLEALSYILDETEQELKNLISKARKIEQGSFKTKDFDILKQVDSIKDLLGRTKVFPSINSFYQKMTNILALDPILIEAIQNKKIYYTIANELNKVIKSNKQKEEIETFLKFSISEDYSLSEAKKAVKKFIQEIEKKDVLESRRGVLKNKIKKITDEIEKMSEKKLEEIEKFLEKFEI